MWRIDAAADQCGGWFTREEDKLDPVWPKLEKKGFDVGPTKTNPNNHPFGERVFLWASCQKLALALLFDYF
jgi:hypothetical protein